MIMQDRGYYETTGFVSGVVMGCVICLTGLGFAVFGVYKIASFGTTGLAVVALIGGTLLAVIGGLIAGFCWPRERFVHVDRQLRRRA